MANQLIVIENEQMRIYTLDDRNQWIVGRYSKEIEVQILLHSLWVGRKHGVFHNIGGVWTYIDGNGKNGTMYNQTHLRPKNRKRVKPILLEHGDIFVFGVNETADPNATTPVWALFLKKEYQGTWQMQDTKQMKVLTFISESERTRLEKPQAGTVIERSGGLAIYMGDKTYMIGDMRLEETLC